MHVNGDTIIMKCSCFRKAEKYGWKWATYAAYSGHLGCLRYAREQGCAWDSMTLEAAAARGHLDCLRYAHENGCEWSPNVPAQAASNGHLDCLRYAHENGCEWDLNTTTFAADGGHLDCLQYAHENGCEWDSTAPLTAAAGQHIDCVRYAYDNGHYWNRWFLGHAHRGVCINLFDGCEIFLHIPKERFGCLVWESRFGCLVWESRYGVYTEVCDSCQKWLNHRHDVLPALSRIIPRDVARLCCEFTCENNVINKIKI